MADDAGALLVRSGLVSSNALDDARARVASLGGTLGEQLVTSGAISDDALTDFYRSRLLVPQVNPNMLARLTPRVVATIPSDMAIELRAIPVSFDGDNNLTVAMSDPSDRHAVDEIAFFTGAYVVRAVATQMQIAWCLAHYYGHVTALGHRLLHAAENEPSVKAAISSGPQRTPRLNRPTGKGDAASASAQVSAPHATPVAPAPPTPISTPAARPRSTPSTSTPAAAPATSTPAPAGPSTPPTGTPATAPHSTPAPASPAIGTAAPAPSPPASPPAAAPHIDYHTPVIIVIDDDDGDDDGGSDDATPSDDTPLMRPGSSSAHAASEDAPDQLRARSISGEIRVPGRRAASIRPPMPQADAEDDDEPLIVIERGEADDDTTGSRSPAPRRRVVKTDPPELYARAGEVDLKSGDDRSIDTDEPRIVIDEDALATPTSLRAIRAPRPAAAAPPEPTMDVVDEADTGARVHDRIVDNESQPILLERPRATPAQFRSAPAAATVPAPNHAGHAPDLGDDDAITGENHIVVLETRKPRSRPERRTQVGFPPVPLPVPVPVPVVRQHRDTETTGLPAMLGPPEPDRTAEARRREVDEDATTLDVRPVPPDGPPSDQLAAPPPPAGYDGTNPHVLAPPPRAAPRSDHRDDDEPAGPGTSVMTALELDEAIPRRTSEAVPAHLAPRHIEYDPVDDGWGPPGTTIPPPLLGAIPGSEDDDEAPSSIPMPSVDSSPLIVGPPSPPPAGGDTGGGALVRALEDATARAIEVIRQLEHAESRDQVVEVLVAHLSETHHRAGFFVMRPGGAKGVTELSLFSMTPRPAVVPFATLRLDRPSTLQDVVGTRLPYRGPMHDDASRTFLISILGACPPEILLVPVAVRERVVGVLFGEHRKRHTFDDQLALAARAAGMALERILKSKRG